MSYHRITKNLYPCMQMRILSPFTAIYPVMQTTYDHVDCNQSISNDLCQERNDGYNDNQFPVESPLSPLDKMRLHNGIHNVKIFFHELANHNKEEAIQFINDENLCFGSLFLLRSEIEELDIFSNLNIKNKMALEITNEILMGKKTITSIDCTSCDYIQRVYIALKWMFETGRIDDGLSNEYDQVLDATAILLIKVYKDRRILPMLVKIIVQRYKKGFYIHDLIWAFFEAQDPGSLILIGDYLRSKQQEEIELANKLLRFIPDLAIHDRGDTQKQYALFMQWMKENRWFLHFTGESLQQSHHPSPYIVDFGAKYLCKPIDIDTGKIIERLTEREKKILNRFEQLRDPIKDLLAKFSFSLYVADRYQWHTWMNYSLEEQIKIVRTGIGGMV
ncbi:hypothetical protein QBE52_15930 [Clostridiaceae bacterium 35-E11]